MLPSAAISFRDETIFETTQESFACTLDTTKPKDSWYLDRPARITQPIIMSELTGYIDGSGGKISNVYLGFTGTIYFQCLLMPLKRKRGRRIRWIS